MKVRGGVRVCGGGGVGWRGGVMGRWVWHEDEGVGRRVGVWCEYELSESEGYGIDVGVKVTSIYQNHV